MGNQVLGRGKVYFDRFVQDTLTRTGEMYLGNTPSFSLSVETQELDHYSSEEGLRIKDQSVTLQVDYTGSFTCDDINLDNVAMFFFGSKATISQAAETATTETITVLKGRYYQLGRTSTLISGKRNVSNVTATRPGNPNPINLTANTDFVVEATLGRVFIPLDSTVPNETAVTFTYNVAQHSRDQAVSGSDLIYGALRFIAFNGVGDQRDFFMPKVALRPNGEYALKGEDWQQFSFNVEVLKLSESTPNVFVDGRPYTPAP